MSIPQDSAVADDAPLAGIVVVDFTRVLAGPYCTRMLADLGARVIKLERPGDGDEVRPIPPQLDPERNDQGAYFARVNAGKRSVAIDFTKPAARQVVIDLVRGADVVVENFSPGVMAKYGFDEPSLREVRPDLVYCSISGFGQHGPLRARQAYAHLVNAFSGQMELETGGIHEPRASNLQAADVLAGTHAFGAICAALLRRARTGRGAAIDVSMLECLLCADDINMPALLNQEPIVRQPRPNMVVHGIGDRHIAVQIGGAPTMWPRLTELMGRPDLRDDPRFATPAGRRANWPALRDEIGAWLEGYPSVDDALQVLDAARVPCSPVLTAEEVIAHPHLAQREAFPTIPHPLRTQGVRVTATPFHLDHRPLHPSGPAPYLIGEGTRQVLVDLLGYSGARIDALIADGVLAEP